MLLIVYLCGCLATMIGVLVAASRFGDRRVSQSLRGLLAVLAGALWPVLVVAGELIAIVVLARRMRAATVAKPDQAPMHGSSWCPSPRSTAKQDLQLSRVQTGRVAAANPLGGEGATRDNLEAQAVGGGQTVVVR